MNIRVVHGVIITKNLNKLVITLGVWPLTLPARAREPCTLPPFRGMVRSMVWFSNTARFTSSSSGAPEQKRFN